MRANNKQSDPLLLSAEGPDPEAAAVLHGNDDLDASQPLIKDKSTAQKVQKWSCLGLVGLTIGLLVAAIICVGVIPWQRYDNGDITVYAVRTYYLSVEEVQWTWTLGGKDLVYGPLLGTYLNSSAAQSDIEGTSVKGRFIEYTDETFTVKKERSAEHEHLGILGPLLYAEAGDTIQIWLRNMINSPLNMEPLGASWNIQGMLGPVGTGLTARFTIDVPLEAGPLASSQQSSQMFLYRSSVNPTRHENTGLVGGIIITRKGDANADGTPKGVDREFVTVYQIFNELETEFAYFNAPNYTKNNWNTERFTINGHSWGTLQGLNAKVGEKVRWYVAALGTENGMHNFHWHGNVLESDGHRLDQLTAIPATTKVADLIADNPGTWLFHCHVNSHLTGGMVTTYTVSGAQPTPLLNGVERVYYIASEEVDWSYAPLGGMACSANGSVSDFNEEASIYLGEPDVEAKRVGSNFTKAIFREYTDGTFTTLKPRTGGSDDDYLGLLGPLIRAQVGDTIRIVFRNNLVKLDVATTMHPHGVLYNKSGEGAPYEDGDTDHADDAVLPGQEHTYIWHVPERAGPGPSDPSSIMWMYHSHADEAADTWAGLVGGIIVTRAGTPLNADGSPADVFNERVLFFAAMAESQSLYGAANAQSYLNLSEADADAMLADPDFQAASLHRSINGYMYCNMQRLALGSGLPSRIHFMALGDIGDMHTPNMGRGGGFLNMGQREDAVQMSAGSMHSVDLVLTEPGTWQMGCNVLEHNAGGISAMYTVQPSNETQAPGQLRTWYIQAEEVQWDYAPNMYVHCTAVNYLPRSATYLNATNTSVGSGMYKKTLYREYTDSTFTQRVPQPAYQGLLGPMMVLEVGDVMRVVLKNSLEFAINLSPGGGLVATGDPEGGSEVQPGKSYTYEWQVPAKAAPTGGVSSVAYPYGSTVDHWTQTVLGLEGLLVVVAKGQLKSGNSAEAKPKAMNLPNDVDYMVPLLWQVFNQNLSPYMDVDLRTAGIDPASVKKDDDDFVESYIKHTVNGLMYCNLPSPRFERGSRVRWVFLSVGAIEGLHAPVLTKFALIDATGAHDSATLMPGYTATMDMHADHKGLFPMWCNVHDHVEAGMSASFEIV